MPPPLNYTLPSSLTAVATGTNTITHTSTSDDSDYSLATGASPVAVTVTGVAKPPDDPDPDPDPDPEPFVRPARIAACEVDAAVALLPFTDLAEDSFALKEIGCIFDLGVTTGTSPTTYGPKQSVTREQMASFLARLYRSLTPTPQPPSPTTIAPHL